MKILNKAKLARVDHYVCGIKTQGGRFHFHVVVKIHVGNNCRGRERVAGEKVRGILIGAFLPMYVFITGELLDVMAVLG